MDGGLQYEDIKGSHVVIHSQYFNGISWRVTVVNQIHMESWLKAVFELPHHTPTKGELNLSDCKWLHFHCNLCVSFYPAFPPLPFLTVSSNVYHIVMLRACVWGVHVHKEEEGVKQQVYCVCVSCILRGGPLNAEHFDEVSVSVRVCVRTNQTSSFSATQIPSGW